jgi:hypothetical protein
MMQDDFGIVVRRTGEDRRREVRLEPPYLTDEGMVLFDRRSHEDRRTGIMQSLLGGVDLHTYLNSKAK